MKVGDRIEFEAGRVNGANTVTKIAALIAPQCRSIRAAALLALAAVAVAAMPARASDQAMQAALQRLNCVPARVKVNKISANVTVYEVACKDARQALTVLCIEKECRVQQTSRDQEEL